MSAVFNLLLSLCKVVGLWVLITFLVLGSYLLTLEIRSYMTYRRLRRQKEQKEFFSMIEEFRNDFE